MEGVVEPTAEVVVAGAGVGVAEEGGDVGVDVRVEEEGERVVIGGGRERWDDGGKGLDGGLDFFEGVGGAGGGISGGFVGGHCW